MAAPDSKMADLLSYFSYNDIFSITGKPNIFLKDAL